MVKKRTSLDSLFAPVEKVEEAAPPPPTIGNEVQTRRAQQKQPPVITMSKTPAAATSHSSSAATKSKNKNSPQPTKPPLEEVQITSHQHHHQSSAPAKARKETINQTVYLPPAVYEQLRHLAFEERRKMHDYLVEGLDRVFKDRGLKPYFDLAGRETK